MSIIEREVQVGTVVEGPITEREHRARTLEGAALEIEVRGWHQGAYQSCDGAVCLRGAVGIAQGVGADYEDTESVWGVDDPATYVSFGNWNDQYDRTANEVTFLLRWRAEEIRDGR